jgi:hypothetical protein
VIHGTIHCEWQLGMITLVLHSFEFVFALEYQSSFTNFYFSQFDIIFRVQISYLRLINIGLSVLSTNKSFDI